MDVSTRASVVVSKPIDRVFDYCCRNETFERHLRPHGPVAGVEKVESLTDGPVAVGTKRRVVLSDGSQLEEAILAHSPPTLHQYRWPSEGLKGPFAALVRSGTGTWRFSEVPGGTSIVWGYDFELRSGLFYPLALPILPLFRRWLARSLASIRDELDG